MRTPWVVTSPNVFCFGSGATNCTGDSCIRAISGSRSVSIRAAICTFKGMCLGSISTTRRQPSMRSFMDQPASWSKTRSTTSHRSEVRRKACSMTVSTAVTAEIHHAKWRSVALPATGVVNSSRSARAQGGIRRDAWGIWPQEGTNSDCRQEPARTAKLARGASCRIGESKVQEGLFQQPVKGAWR